MRLTKDGLSTGVGMSDREKSRKPVFRVKLRCPTCNSNLRTLPMGVVPSALYSQLSDSVDDPIIEEIENDCTSCGTSFMIKVVKCG